MLPYQPSHGKFQTFGTTDNVTFTPILLAIVLKKLLLVTIKITVITIVKIAKVSMLVRGTDKI